MYIYIDLTGSRTESKATTPLRHGGLFRGTAGGSGCTEPEHRRRLRRHNRAHQPARCPPVCCHHASQLRRRRRRLGDGKRASFRMADDPARHTETLLRLTAPVPRSADEHTRRRRTSRDISRQSLPSSLHEAGVNGTSALAMLSASYAPWRDRGPPSPARMRSRCPSSGHRQRPTRRRSLQLDGHRR